MGLNPLGMQTLQKATNRETRRINQRLVMGTIYDEGPISRAHVARVTGLTRTTVSDVVDGLLTDGLAEEIGFGQSTGGKAPILLRVPDDARQLIGIEVGDVHLSGAIVNLRGEIRHAVELPLDARDGERALSQLDLLVDRLMAGPHRPLLGIGLGTPGLIDTSTGTVQWAVNFDWRDLPLGQHIAERWKLRTYVVNDSQAAALAEHTFGGHARRPNMVVVKVGRGIGAGFVLDGRLYQGDGFGAGEIGHTAVADGNRPCHCGSFGCLETIASTRAVVEHARELAPRFAGSGEIDLDTLVEAFQSGDALANEVVVDAAEHLGRAIGALIGVLNVEHIVLVGEMTRFGEPWLSAVRREARRSALALLADRAQIEIGRLSPNLVVLGSAALLMTRELGLTFSR
jgi:N-acetylglucosamine repressor